MKFIPFSQVKEHEQVLVVDSYFQGKTMFSHWRGAPRIPGLHDDTSTGIALNAIKAGHDACEWPYVSNNHFDIDGFLGIWAVINPQLALEYEDMLRAAALIGDFREWNPYEPYAEEALKLCCWINSQERELFYEPFGEKEELKACVKKYAYFLDALPAFLANSHSFESQFIEEYKKVWKGHKALESKGHIESLSDIRLQLVRTPEPIHYYALFQQSRDADMILSIYDQNRYELEYKYTSWVDTQDRVSYPRLSFRDLAEKLNEIEASKHLWEYDRMMDTGPMLRLNKTGLTKAERYAHPYMRKIYPSSIKADTLCELIIQYYRDKFTDKKPRASWTWKEMRDFVI